MGRATSKGIEEKRKIKYPSDITQPGFEPSCYRAVAKIATNYAILYDKQVKLCLKYFLVTTKKTESDKETFSSIGRHIYTDNS